MTVLEHAILVCRDKEVGTFVNPKGSCPNDVNYPSYAMALATLGRAGLLTKQGRGRYQISAEMQSLSVDEIKELCGVSRTRSSTHPDSYIEVDPSEVFDQWEPTGLLELLTNYVAKLRADSSHERMRANEATEQLNAGNTLVNTLRSELANERARVMQLREELNKTRSYEKTHYVERTIRVREPGYQPQREHGTSGLPGGALQRVKVHHKPSMAHVPKGVLKK